LFKYIQNCRRINNVLILRLGVYISKWKEIFQIIGVSKCVVSWGREEVISPYSFFIFIIS